MRARRVPFAAVTMTTARTSTAKRKPVEHFEPMTADERAALAAQIRAALRAWARAHST